MELEAQRIHGDVFRIVKQVMGCEFFIYLRAEDRLHAIEKAIRSPHAEWARLDKI